MNKIATIVVGVLAAALVMGTGYLILRPAEQVGAVGVPDGRGRNHETWISGTGRTSSETARGQLHGGDDQNAAGGDARIGGQGSGRDCDGEIAGIFGQEQGAVAGGARGINAASGQGSGRGINGLGEPLNENHNVEWEIVTGEIVELDSEMLVQTADGNKILIGLGQSWYRDDTGFNLAVGDEVTVEGFYEDGEFKAGTVENLTTGERLTLRDTSGHPMWAGRGQGQNRETAQELSGTYASGYENGNRDSQLGRSDTITETVNVSSTSEVEALTCPICDDAESYEGMLSVEEVEGLLLALNDEYHAWAVYEQVIQDFGAVRPFTSIQNAEANHIAALTHLFEIYGLSIPENPWIEAVTGYESVSSACAAGVNAENANSALYDTLFASTKREDILEIYTALQRASIEQHLPAFSRCAD